MDMSYELDRAKHAFKKGRGFTHMSNRLKSAIFRSKVNLVRYIMRGHTCIIGASLPQGISISKQGFDISEGLNLRGKFALIDCEAGKNRKNDAAVSIHGGAEVYISDTKINADGMVAAMRLYT
jgi:hypothetical protein